MQQFASTALTPHRALAANYFFTEYLPKVKLPLTEIPAGLTIRDAVIMANADDDEIPISVKTIAIDVVRLVEEKRTATAKQIRSAESFFGIESLPCLGVGAVRVSSLNDTLRVPVDSPVFLAWLQTRHAALHALTPSLSSRPLLVPTEEFRMFLSGQDTTEKTSEALMSSSTHDTSTGNKNNNKPDFMCAALQPPSPQQPLVPAFIEFCMSQNANATTTTCKQAAIETTVVPYTRERYLHRSLIDAKNTRLIFAHRPHFDTWYNSDLKCAKIRELSAVLGRYENSWTEAEFAKNLTDVSAITAGVYCGGDLRAHAPGASLNQRYLVVSSDTCVFPTWDDTKSWTHLSGSLQSARPYCWYADHDPTKLYNYTKEISWSLRAMTNLGSTKIHFIFVKDDTMDGILADVFGITRTQRTLSEHDIGGPSNPRMKKTKTKTVNAKTREDGSAATAGAAAQESASSSSSSSSSSSHTLTRIDKCVSVRDDAVGDGRDQKNLAPLAPAVRSPEEIEYARRDYERRQNEAARIEAKRRERARIERMEQRARRVATETAIKQAAKKKQRTPSTEGTPYTGPASATAAAATTATSSSSSSSSFSPQVSDNHNALDDDGDAADANYPAATTSPYPLQTELDAIRCKLSNLYPNLSHAELRLKVHRQWTTMQQRTAKERESIEWNRRVEPDCNRLVKPLTLVSENDDGDLTEPEPQSSLRSLSSPSSRKKPNALPLHAFHKLVDATVRQQSRETQDRARALLAEMEYVDEHGRAEGEPRALDALAIVRSVIA